MSDQRRCNVTFTTPFDLPADHYVFVPQVEVTDPSVGNFFWLSATKRIPARRPAELDPRSIR